MLLPFKFMESDSRRHRPCINARVTYRLSDVIKHSAICDAYAILHWVEIVISYFQHNYKYIYQLSVHHQLVIYDVTILLVIEYIQEVIYGGKSHTKVR